MPMTNARKARMTATDKLKEKRQRILNRKNMVTIAVTRKPLQMNRRVFNPTPRTPRKTTTDQRRMGIHQIFSASFPKKPAITFFDNIGNRLKTKSDRSGYSYPVPLNQISYPTKTKDVKVSETLGYSYPVPKKPLEYPSKPQNSTYKHSSESYNDEKPEVLYTPPNESYNPPVLEDDYQEESDDGYLPPASGKDSAYVAPVAVSYSAPASSSGSDGVSVPNESDENPFLRSASNLPYKLFIVGEDNNVKRKIVWYTLLCITHAFICKYYFSVIYVKQQYQYKCAIMLSIHEF